MFLKKLYRRAEMMDSIPDEWDITPGSSRTFDFGDSMGWYAFDVKTEVSSNADGSIPNAYLDIKRGSEAIIRLRASWPWTRQYVYCGKGETTIVYENHGLSEVKIRNQNMQYFRPVDGLKFIEKAQLPKPLEEMVKIDIMGGYTRYQSTSKVGTEKEFTAIFDQVEKYQDFMRNLANYYILEGQEGVYGGVILPQSLQQEHIGGLYLVHCTLHSPSSAGVGNV